jgi:hypothetical protein
MRSMTPLNDNSPTICVDLDGVLNMYDQWVAPDYFHPVRPGADGFLRRLRQSGYRVIIYTCRWHEWVSAWLRHNNLSQYVDGVTDKKLPAVAYLDDRGICFQGDFDAAFDQIQRFRPFWEPISAEECAE